MSSGLREKADRANPRENDDESASEGCFLGVSASSANRGVSSRVSRTVSADRDVSSDDAALVPALSAALRLDGPLVRFAGGAGGLSPTSAELLCDGASVAAAAAESLPAGAFFVRLVRLVLDLTAFSALDGLASGKLAAGESR